MERDTYLDCIALIRCQLLDDKEGVTAILHNADLPRLLNALLGYASSMTMMVSGQDRDAAVKFLDGLTADRRSE